MNNTAKRAEQQHWPIYVVEDSTGCQWELRAPDLGHAEAHLGVFYPHSRIVGLRAVNGSIRELGRIKK